MLTFFKNFGKGIIYVLVLPLLLVGLALYGVVAFFVFIYLAIKGLVLFFTGRSLFEDLPEDKEAKRRIALANGTLSPSEPVSEPETPVEEQEEIHENTSSIDNDPFYVPEYLKPEQPEEENYVEPDAEIPNEEQPKIVHNAPIEDAPEEEIIIQKNAQNSVILDINDLNEDDSDDSGVNIDFE